MDDEFNAIVASLRAKRSSAPFSVDRCILRAVNEAIYCLQEGVATTSDIDEAMALGTGFPNEGGVGVLSTVPMRRVSTGCSLPWTH